MIRTLLEVMAFQLIFLLVYDLFLKKETFFQWNRWYLLSTYALSLLLPFIRIEAFSGVVPGGRLFKTSYIQRLDEITVSAGLPEGTSPGISWVTIIFITGSMIALLFFAKKFYSLYRIKKNGRVEEFAHFTKIIVAKSSLAFSFFRNIFIGESLDKDVHKHIVAHEMVHITQRHSLDLIYFELFRILHWFNPLVYIYQQRISELHEFIADEKVPKAGRKHQYALLLSAVFETQHVSFINQFFQSSLIKKRIVMLKKSRSSKIWKFKYLLLVPVIGIMLCYSSCQNDTPGIADETMQVQDVEHMSQAEEQKLYTRLTALSNSESHWKFVVTDGKSTLQFMESDGDSYISGPNNEQIKARMIWDGEFSEDFNVNNVLLGNNAPVPFGLVEEVPVFPGCEDSDDPRSCFNKHMQEHIRANFSYPKEAIDQGIQGRVNIMFTIDPSGKVTDIKKRGPSKFLENEAVRIIELLPQMQPGRQQGKAVSVPYSIPISFRLTNQS